ncbi:MAG: alcohol dehydrogenase catalytic domain-containing protein [bacterium]
MTTPTSLPTTQYAVQLTGPGKLRLNTSKPVEAPGPHQVLGVVESVGLCFSDLKLLKQFSEHPRKSEVTQGLAHEVLKEIPSYVPGDKPAVPGHEAVIRIVAVGKQVQRHKVGERCLVQADYRGILTAGSNAAFGYNFEGALQEYVSLDERVIIDSANGDRFLIPVPEHLSSSALALIEPWACVENSYVTPERRTIKAGGKLAVVVDDDNKMAGIEESLAPQGHPAAITVVCAGNCDKLLAKVSNAPVKRLNTVAELANESFDDIIYFGSDRKIIELLNDKLATCGLINIVTAGRKIGAPVLVGVGRVHYGMTRWIGTTSGNAAESYKGIPDTGEIRAGDTICVTGAGGPMGQMHVIRDLCTGRQGVVMTAVDFDDVRLASVMDKAQPLAEANKATIRTLNPKKETLSGPFSYQVVMAPVGSVVADAITTSAPGCRINVFAGIPANVKHELDLDTYIRNRCYMFGTSGSTIRDMKIVLEKVVAGTLDTNRSVDAICGMAGALDGLAAVENRTLAGKIVVYPALHELGLVPLKDLAKTWPSVAGKLDHGNWTLDAERELLRVAK